MRRLISSILFLLVTASISTAAYALKVQIFVNGSSTPVVDTTTLSTPQADGTGPTDSGPSLTVTIPNGNYPAGCTGTGCLLSIAGPSNQPGATFSGLASVIKNGATISVSSSVTTKINIQGTIQYKGTTNPGTIEIVTGNKFILPTGVWTTVGKGGAKCRKNVTTQCLGYATGAYCPFPTGPTCSASNIQDGTCTFCRSYDATDEGDVYRPAPTQTDPGNKVSAGNVTVTLRSEVGFFDTVGNQVRTELVGGGVPANPASPSGGVAQVTTSSTNPHFYLGNKVGPENIACETLFTDSNAAFTCASNERKTNRLKFTGLQPNDIVDLPLTSTDFGASDPGVLEILIGAKFLIDVQPIAVVANTDPQTQDLFPLIPDYNNSDWNPTKTSGKRQVLALNSYKENGELNVDACSIPTENVKITVGGSFLTSAESSQQAFLGGTGPCIGKIFFFDYGEVNSSIPGDKLASCQANPTATLVASDVPLSSTYQSALGSSKGGGKPSAPLLPDANCELNATTGVTTCTLNVEVGGSQFVRCCTSCG